MLRNINEITGYKLRAIDGEIGRCKDFLFDDRRWAIRYMVAATHRWLPGGRKVLISPISLGEPDWEDHELPVQLVCKTIQDSPLLDEHEPVSRQYESEFFKYYGYGYYWMGSDLWGTHPHPAALIENPIPEAPPKVEVTDQHLRSCQEVKGYKIQATDKPIGHIEDFIVNDNNWAINFIAIDTRNWIPGGRKVLISSNNIMSISWKDRSVSIDLTAEQIKNSPEYDPMEFIDPEYVESMSDF